MNILIPSITIRAKSGSSEPRTHTTAVLESDANLRARCVAISKLRGGLFFSCPLRAGAALLTHRARGLPAIHLEELKYTPHGIIEHLHGRGSPEGAQEAEAAGYSTAWRAAATLVAASQRCAASATQRCASHHGAGSRATPNSQGHSLRTREQDSLCRHQATRGMRRIQRGSRRGSAPNVYSANIRRAAKNDMDPAASIDGVRLPSSQ